MSRRRGTDIIKQKEERQKEGEREVGELEEQLKAHLGKAQRAE